MGAHDIPRLSTSPLPLTHRLSFLSLLSPLPRRHPPSPRSDRVTGRNPSQLGPIPAPPMPHGPFGQVGPLGHLGYLKPHPPPPRSSRTCPLGNDEFTGRSLTWIGNPTKTMPPPPPEAASAPGQSPLGREAPLLSGLALCFPFSGQSTLTKAARS